MKRLFKRLFGKRQEPVDIPALIVKQYKANGGEGGIFKMK